MTSQTGIACHCGECNQPQWFSDGRCGGCASPDRVEYTWVAKATDGGVPSAAPSAELVLQAGATSELARIWSNLVVLRGLSPYLTDVRAVAEYSSAPWYVQRGVDTTVRIAVPSDPDFGRKLNRASAWTNQSFVIRLTSVFESFGGFEQWSAVRLPASTGMRELHHARKMRNKIAHGDPLDATLLTDEAVALFGPDAVAAGACNLDISLVLEPLWARLMIYAASLEEGTQVPANPGVVVAASNGALLIQTPSGLLQVQRSSGDLEIGQVVSVP